MFPYLQYKTTDTDGTNKQTKDNAIKGNDKGGARPIQSWAQTHDVNGTGLGSPDLVEDTDNATKYGGYSGYETGASRDRARRGHEHSRMEEQRQSASHCRCSGPPLPQQFRQLRCESV